ncbi:MAG: serine/threonine-protein kinase [Pirellulales bacterium]
MTTSARCNTCGSELTPGAAGGLCPRCLMQAGLDSPVASTTASGGFVPPTPAELAPKFPQLEILGLVGKGGMGAVYKARQKALDRLVALKILPPEAGRDPAFAERFTREARAMAKLSHPHIVAIYDFGQASGQYYFLMEYIDGTNLRQTMQSGGLSSDQALAVVPQICDALQYAHDEGIVHRDIKPENILLDKKGRVKIADFGLSKLMSSGGDNFPDISLTGTQQVMGTLRYMAPEQMQSTKTVDHRADIYSLGVVFYELLTGELPMGRFAPPSKKVQIDVRLDEVVLRALEQEPSQRYQQASDIKTQVQEIALRPATSAAAVPATDSVRVHKLLDAVDTRNRRWQHLGSFVGLLLFLLGAGLIAWQGVFLGMGIPFIAGIFLMARAIRTKQRWNVEYKRHWIRFENGVLTAEKLYLDDGLVTAGGFGYRMELRTTIKAGEGKGDVIVVWTEAGLWHYRCRIHVEELPAGAVSPSAKMADNTVTAPVSRINPRFVSLLATLNIVVALFLLAANAAPDEMPFPESTPRLWRVWGKVETALGFLSAAGLFAAGVGLFLGRPWARRLVIGVCIFELAALVIDMPYLMQAFLPHILNDMREWTIQQGDTPEQAETTAIMIGSLFWGVLLLVYLPFHLVQLVYFTRPHVVAAFGVETAAPAKPRRSWEATWQSWPTTVRNVSQALLVVVYFGCVIMVFGYSGSSTVTPAGRDTKFAVGSPTPWFVADWQPTGFQSAVRLNSWSVAVAVLGLGLLCLIRRLEWLERGRVHSMNWHYGIWAFLALVAAGIGLLSWYVG